MTILYLKEKMMIIHTFEDGGRTLATKMRLERELPFFGIKECIILPIPSSRDGVTLSGCDVSLEAVANMTGEGILTVGYAIPEGIKSSIKNKGGMVYDASLDEEFLVGNAELTAIAAIGLLLTTERRVPADMTFGIVGYGRIGRELVRHLLFLGASLRIFTTRRDVRLLLSEFGVATSESTSGADLSHIDVLINTAPARIFDTDTTYFPRELRIIDLASGNNFPESLSIESYPSIPARMYPESSGYLLAERAISYVEGLYRK